MSFSVLSKVALAGLALAFCVILGVGIWAAVEADDESTSVPLAVAELESASGGDSTARLEVVQTGDRTWLKFQVRDTEGEDGIVIIGTGEDAIAIAVAGDGDYSLPQDSAVGLDGEPVEFAQDEVMVLSGTWKSPD